MSRLRLVKLAFLLSLEPETRGAGVYEFLPYRRGPFSFTLYHDLRGLGAGGWVAEGDHRIQLAKAAEEDSVVDSHFLDIIDGISDRWLATSTSSLIDSVYAAHPWFTMNSEVVHKRAVPRPVAAPAVFTVGYEGIMVDGLLNLLLQTGVRRLIDVRCNPIARRYGFHKSTLNRLCADLGIEYLHFPSLGIPSAWRANLDDSAAYQQLFDRYEGEILPNQRAAIAQVANLVANQPSALMCMESDHACCHRSRLARVVAEQTSLPIRELR